LANRRRQLGAERRQHLRLGPAQGAVAHPWAADDVDAAKRPAPATPASACSRPHGAGLLEELKAADDRDVGAPDGERQLEVRALDDAVAVGVGLEQSSNSSGAVASTDGRDTSSGCRIR
jgi:hypothetical protein